LLSDIFDFDQLKCSLIKQLQGFVELFEFFERITKKIAVLRNVQEFGQRTITSQVDFVFDNFVSSLQPLLR